MKKLLSLLCLIMSFALHANEVMKEFNLALVQPVKLEATQKLKNQLTQDLKERTGLDKFSLKVDFKLDEVKLKKELTLKDTATDKYQGYQLPGLFVEGEKEQGVSFYRRPVIADIYNNVSNVTVDLVYHTAEIEQSALQSAIKQIIQFNSIGLSAAQIVVNTKLDESTWSSLGLNEFEKSIKGFVEKPIAINFSSGQFIDFWNQNFKLVTAIIAASIFLLTLLIAIYIRGGFGSISEAIKNKKMEGAASNSSVAAKSENKQQDVSPYANAAHSLDHFESYVEVQNYLAKLLEQDSKTFSEVILLKLMVEDFVSLTLLLDVVPKAKREIFMNNLDQDKRERFRHYVLNQGSLILKDEAKLKNLAVKMIKLIKVSSLAPGELYNIVAVDLIHGLGSEEASKLLSECNQHEQSFLVEHLSSNQLAYLFQEDLLDQSILSQECPQFEKSELIGLIIKASKYKQKDVIRTLNSKIEDVYAQVETSKAETLADAIGLPAHLRFENLFMTYQQAGINYLQGLDFNHLAKLYPLLTDNIQTTILAELPELLVERLKVLKTNVSSEGLQFKAEFYYYLKSLVDESDNVVHHSFDRSFDRAA
jgi:hypothetical protein